MNQACRSARPTRTPRYGTFHGIPKYQIQEFTWTGPCNKFELPLPEQATSFSNRIQFIKRTTDIRNPSLLLVASPIPHPCTLAPSPPHRAAPVTLPPHTPCMAFPHGPRAFSHVTPPGPLHSRPARSRGRPLQPLHRAYHQPRVAGA
jgi:hypothetical protein